MDNPNPIPGHQDWYGLFYRDDRFDDYFDDDGRERSGVRLHLGGVSWGCVTVNGAQDDAVKKWQQIRSIINGTKKGTVDFRAGPHWWNGTKQTTHYGTLVVK